MKTSGRAVFFGLILSLVGACKSSEGTSSNGNSAGSGTTPSVSESCLISGKIQKGPFVLGSEVKIQELGDDLSPNGNVFITQTSNSFGEFNYSGKIGTKFIEVIVTGYYFDEVSAVLSNGQLTLRTIIPVKNPRGDQSAGERQRDGQGRLVVPGNVNILTSLQYGRLKYLFQNGETFKNAYSESMTQALQVFGFQPLNNDELSSLSIASTGSGNAKLLAASAILLQSAHLRSSGPNEVTAKLSELISSISTDIEQDGVLTSATFISALAAASKAIDVPTTIRNLKARYADLGATVTISDFNDLVTSPWGHIAEMPITSGGNISATAVGFGSKIFVFNLGGNFSQVRAYNLDSGAWETKASPPTINYYRSVATIGSKAYFAGGYGPSTELLEYDLDNDTWAPKAPMPIGLQNHASVSNGGLIYIIGGLWYGGGSSVEKNELYVYDPILDSWTQKASMNAARRMLSAAALNGKIYAFGSLAQGVSTFEEYDIQTDTWSILGNMPLSLYNSAIGLVSGTIYLFGGLQNSYPAVSDKVFAYNPTTNSWAEKTAWPVPENTYGRIGTVLNNKIYIPAGAYLDQYEPLKDQ